MNNLDELSPAAYRDRYEALQEAARTRAKHPVPPPHFAEIPDDAVIRRDRIPPGWYAALQLRRGNALRILNPSGTPGAAIFLWNADDTSERFNAGDTMKIQWTANLTTGRVLFSDMGRVLASITADSGAGHDSIIGPNTPAQSGGARNGRDNLRCAAAKFGMNRRDLAPALSLFSPIKIDDAGRFHFAGNPPAGAVVELRAEMNLLVALSNTPHALSPAARATGPIDFVSHRAPPATEADLCRNFTAEASRGFENNAALFAA
jgi:urea carboxylase-associated protein 2